MQVLLGPRPGAVAGQNEGDDLLDLYPWPESGSWVRGMMVTTLDGSPAGADGRSRSISSEEDREILATARRLADVVLIGAGTMRAERYGPMRGKEQDAQRRAGDGQLLAPVVAIVSASLELPWEERLFTDSAIRPIVITTARADGTRRQQAEQHADVITVPGDRVEPGAMLDLLADRGLRRVVCEGGPRLLAAIAASGRLDEADLSIAPLMTSGGQVSTGDALASAAGFEPVQVIAGAGGFLFTRYVARRTPAEGSADSEGSEGSEDSEDSEDRS